jgi:hypothetical protein
MGGNRSNLNEVTDNPSAGLMIRTARGARLLLSIVGMKDDSGSNP